MNEATTDANPDPTQTTERRTTRNTNTDGTPQRHIERKRKKRKQNSEQETQTPEKRAQGIDSGHTSVWLKRFWKDINESVDKLIIIKRQDKPTMRPVWYLVQVDLDETNERRAQKTGEHHVRCCTRHFTDARKRLVRNCRFWPLIREIKPDGNFGDIVFIRPAKADETLAKKVCTRGWCQARSHESS